MKIQLLLIGVLFFSGTVDAKDYLASDQIITDEVAAGLITVITSTHPIKSVPDVSYLYEAQKSLFINSTLAKCKKIIVFDGLASPFKGRKDNYNRYKQNIKSLLDTDYFFENTHLIFCDEWVHLSGAIRKALAIVTTPFVFIHQHDMPCVKNFDLNGCVTSMILNTQIKYIKFATQINAMFNGHLVNDWYGSLDDVIDGDSVVPLTRMFGWADHAHLARTDYYRNIIMPLCSKGFNEAI